MRLVVQGPSIRNQHLVTLTHLVPSYRGEQFTQVGEHAYYLPNQQEVTQQVVEFCTAEKIDYAYVQNQHTLNNIGLVVMDMDSTLISIECIDEIADLCGLKPQVAEITESAMRGEIEFAESLRRRVKLLTGLDESALQRVIDERLQLNPGALEWIACCKQHNIKTLLVSGGFDFFAERVQAMTGIDHVRANSLEIIDGKLTGHVLGNIVDAQVKADALTQLGQQLGLKQDQIIAVGDGANDLKMMAAAGAGVAYHAKPIVQEQASYALNHSGLDGLIHLFTT
ncbi:MAG: phosphoserine phosphatase SerB [Betaproteobacteria bacterium HGW-Betaproteobacteria-1]|jgi:phosphoserine phosphatase|nr:MAG: phosphoserine phosphatase SerB [Betaproteobacteria bacterium HGW-Betaproteobacteria-1]